MRLDGVVVSAGCSLPQIAGNSGAAVTVKDSLMTLCIWGQASAGQPVTLNFNVTVVGKPLSQVCSSSVDALKW